MSKGRTKDERRDRINELGGYDRLFSAIGKAASLWPSREAPSGISISVFAFVDALDDVETVESEALLQAKDTDQ